MLHPETHVVRRGDSRPCGPAGHCTYCHEPIGQKHKPDCVCRQKTVVVEWTFRVTVTAPEHATPEDVEAYYNDSSYCASNAVDQLMELSESRHNGCVCNEFEAKFIRDATPHDEEHSLVESVLDDDDEEDEDEDKPVDSEAGG